MNENGIEEKDYSELSIEELFAGLENIAEMLESGEVPLEESFLLYEKGMRMLREANARIDLVEKKMLKVTAGGECPGIMKLEKKDGAWKVASFESAGDGEQYSEDIVRFANGDKELEEMYFRSSGAAEDSILDQYQRVAVVEYVKANQLDIEAYQDYGSDPVSVTD